MHLKKKITRNYIFVYCLDTGHATESVLQSWCALFTLASISDISDGYLGIHGSSGVVVTSKQPLCAPYNSLKCIVCVLVEAAATSAAAECTPET